MVRRFALTVVAVLIAGVGSLGRSPQPTENAFTVIGIVQMSTSSDGRETVVSVDRDDAVQPAASSVLPANNGWPTGARIPGPAWQRSAGPAGSRSKPTLC